MKYQTIVIGIDQSYKRTGISISADGELRLVRSKDLTKYKSNFEKRRALRKTLSGLLTSVVGKAKEIKCIIERIRLRSQGFLNIDYIKTIGALNSVIVDIMSEHSVPVYSVDTRCWKAQVVGTSKPIDNSYGVPPEKWPTVVWCVHKGFRENILIDLSNTRRSKGTFSKNGKKYMYDNDAADSAAISMFWFVGDLSKLEEEK